MRLQDTRHQLEQVERRDIVLQACIAGLSRLQALVSRPPRVVILGEVNSGKTSLADLLLGVRLLPASVIANTRVPLLIHYSETVTLHAVNDDGRHLLSADEADELAAGMQIKQLEIGLPNELLKEFEIIDTPADSDTGDVAGDIRIWCTVASRAWTESERAHWSSLPRRDWRNALLVATHKDALETAADATKIEWRLRAAAGDMFRDVVIVSAVGVQDAASDTDATTLLDRIIAWSGEIQRRRAAKVERLASRLARLTLHQLVRVPLKTSEARIVREWEIDCARLLSRLDDPSGDLIDVLQQLLRRFANAAEMSAPGSIGTHGRWTPPAGATPRDHSLNGPAARRYAKLIAADLTLLLRKELSRVGPRDASLFSDYEAATAALLPIARLDKVIDDLGMLFASRPTIPKPFTFERPDPDVVSRQLSGFARAGR